MIVKKFLCVCSAGSVRSVSLATALKTHFGQDAIAVGVHKNGQEVIKLLCDWADYIILMTPQFKKLLPKEIDESKIRIVDVGADVWGNPFDVNLHRPLCEKAQEWYNKNWEI